MYFVSCPWLLCADNAAKKSDNREQQNQMIRLSIQVYYNFSRSTRYLTSAYLLYPRLTGKLITVRHFAICAAFLLILDLLRKAYRLKDRKKIVFSKILFFFFSVHRILLTFKGVRLSKIKCQFVNRIYTSIWLHLRLSYGFTFKIEFIKRQELMALMAKKWPQSIFIEFYWMEKYIWWKPPSNSFEVDYLLCVGQTPNIALSISVSPAATQKIEKKSLITDPLTILNCASHFGNRQVGDWNRKVIA